MIHFQYIPEHFQHPHVTSAFWWEKY